ncbi:hypothetical protein EZS27_038286 [termite gut metagenome]|uniref:Conjugative transposon TraJ C-terminal domain-containing protein n=1 Tax=termite gut metagenome TaxID=433724 RepID=A0A5J4PLQ1_9ZZZZ
MSAWKLLFNLSFRRTQVSNTVYIIFMIIGIVGYFTVPSVAGWVIQAGGMSGYNRNLTATAARTGAVAGGIAGAVTGNIFGQLVNGNGGGGNDSSSGNHSSYGDSSPQGKNYAYAFGNSRGASSGYSPNSPPYH